MKKTIYLLALCAIVAACNFSKGTQKDFTTGFSMTYNGFHVGEFGLVVNNEQVKTKDFDLGQKIAIEVDDVTGYEQKEGRVFPGLDLRVIDKDGNVVLDGADILKNDAGYEPQAAAVLRGTITIGDPMKSGETYHAKMRVWDKIKPENEIVIEGDIVVK